MPDILETATDSLSDYTKKLEIASYYTNGDADRAKQMIAGTLKDIFVIKGRFSSTSSFGAFIAFYNQFYLTLNSVYVVISDSFTLKDIKTSIEWRNFEKDLTEFLSNNEHDDVLGHQFRSAFTSAFNLQFSGEFRKLFDTKDEIGINRLFQQIVQNRMGFQSVNMSVDIEIITSLEMELYSLTSHKIIEFKDNNQKDDKQADNLDIRIDDEDDAEILKGREIKLILRGSLILSPISGRDIGLIVVGDRIKVKILDSNSKAIQVAKAFNAYDEEGIHPIIGRVVSIRHRLDGGYTLFVIVAKGIYVKIEELEENIKIAIDTTFLNSDQQPGKLSKASIAIIVSLCVVLVFLIVLLIIIFK